ncbi:hypothetical protein Ddye_019072 [Dipteronia dyeriana]|uniref:Hexosyltransferase n=1 Tax=Dipteronia dyeriana TaxID=168575 RepID=A0AAD9WVE0_9ROSI|nr:hypothetical protein Ddye_019072 [Dipteronia dyeriana]
MGTKILPTKYIMKTDDDAFVRIDEVLPNLKEEPSNGLLHGLISYKSSLHRDKDIKWYICDEEWPHDSYLQFDLEPWPEDLPSCLESGLSDCFLPGPAFAVNLNPKAWLEFLLKIHSTLTSEF